jgi:hypothetical protein
MDIGDSFQNAMDRLVGFLPNLLACLVILIIGYFIAKIVATVVGKILDRIGVDQRLHEAGGHNYVERALPGASAAKAVAIAVFWLIFIFFVVNAIGALKLPAATTFMNQVLAYLPNIIAAIIIFIIAAIVAGLVSRASSRLMAGSATGRILATALPALVMVIALFMILQQLQIAQAIVQIAFAATMGALALGLALAFGLGGRSVAQQLLEEGYASARRDREAARAYAATGATGTTSTTGTAGTTTGTTAGTGTLPGSHTGSGTWNDTPSRPSSFPDSER